MIFKFDNDIITHTDFDKINFLVKIRYIEKGLIPLSNEKDFICKALLTLSDEEQRIVKRKFRKILRSGAATKSKLKRMSKAAKRANVYSKIHTEILLKYNYINDK